MKHCKTELNYFTTYTDANGHEHYAVHKYRRTNGIVTSMRDLKLDGASYEKQYSIDKFIVEHDCASGMWRVIDTTAGSSVGTFWTKEDADEYAEFKNGSFMYMHDNDDVDPWS